MMLLVMLILPDDDVAVVAGRTGSAEVLDIASTLQSIHAQLDIVLVQHELLSDEQLMALARRIHFAMGARRLAVQNTWQ